MARAPIEVGIASETKAFKQGMESGVIKPTEDATQALDDLGKSRGPEHLERELEEAQKATKNLDKEVERTADDIEQEFRKAYRSVERNAESASRVSSEAMQETKREALSNAAETFSSFDGSVESFADGVQGTLGALTAGLAGLSPAAAAAAGGAAIGIGLVATALGAQNEAAAEAKEALVSMYRDATEEGRTFLSEAQIIAAAADILFDDTKRKEAQAEAEKLGVSVGSYVRAISGDQVELNRILDYGAGKLSELSKIGDDKSKAGQAAALAEQQAYENALRPLEKTAEQHIRNKEAAQAYESFTSESAKRQQQNLDTTQKRLEGMAKGYNVPVTIDTSQFDRWLENAKRNATIRLKATDQYGRNF